MAIETPSQKKGKQAEKAENPLETKLAELQAQVNANEAEKQANIEKAAQAAEEKKQSSLREQEEELQAASDVTKLLASLDEGSLKNADKMRTIEDLSNAQLIDVLTSSVEKALNARDKLTKGAVKKEVDSVKESVGGIKRVLQQMFAKTNVDAARARHKDFDDHREGILAEMARCPGLEPEDAYILAVSKAAQKAPAKRNTETERPSGPDVQPKTERVRTEHDLEVGVSAFRSIVSDGFDRALAAMDRPEE